MKTRILLAALFFFLLWGGRIFGQVADGSGALPLDCNQHPDSSACQQYLGQSDRTKAGSNQTMTVPTLQGGQAQDRTDDDSNRPGRTGRIRELPPQPPTEFQLLVADSVGRSLPVYGSDLFRSPVSFAPLDRVPVPADYVIGPGDELYVRIWGQVNAELRTTVDRNGKLFVPKVGEIAVAGTHASRLNEFLRAEIGRSFRNFEVAGTLGHLRSIDIFLVGQVRHPGKYTVGSLSTLVNALFESGGPSVQGSLRHIQVKRNGQIVTEFDLYDLLLKGDTSRDVSLLPGDVIYVPTAGPAVAVSGSVNTSAIYELKNGQGTLDEVIELAGGLNSVADGTKVTVERIDERKGMSVAEFSLDGSGRSQPVKDGDIVRVYSIVPKFANAVTLRGNVANPGRFPWRPGMRIRDLIPNKETLLTRNFWSQQNGLVDGSATNYKPMKNFGRRTKRAEGSEEYSANQQEPRALETERVLSDKDDKVPASVDPAQLRNEVKLAAPELNWDYASIQRLDPVDLTTTIIPFSLGKAILENRESDNVELKPGDVITIFSQHDLAVPMNRQTHFVHVEGEVVSPGIYRIDAGETLRTAVERAGGLSSSAYLYGTQLTRVSARKEQQESLDRLVQILESEIQQRASADVKGSPEDAAAITARVESQRRLIDQLRSSKATGRVVLAMKPGDVTSNSLPAIVLEDGDRLLIPARSGTVSVVGSVYTQSSFLYREGSSVGHYLRAAGGGSRTADLKNILLVRADGSVIGKSSGSVFSGGLSSLRVFPGDTIVVPTKLQSSGFSRALRDWTQVASQLAITAASLSIVSR